MPDGAIYIGKVLYKYKGDIPENTDFAVKEGTVMITSGAFSGCGKIEQLSIPKSTVVIDVPILVECQYIKVAKDNPVYDSRGNSNAIIETASNNLIQGSLSTKEIPEDIKIISTRAFEDVLSSENLIIPDAVDSIGYCPFGGYKLQSVTIGKGLRKIDDMFNNCHNLREIKVSASNPYFDSRDNCNAMIETATNTLVVGCRGTIIPSTVKIIGEHAFNTYDYSVKSIVIPDNVEEIQYWAFGGLTGLKSVTIGYGVRKIGNYAFANFSKGDLIMKSSSPCTLDDNSFFTNNYEGLTLYVPKGAKSNYQYRTGWNKFKNIVDGRMDGDIFTASTKEGIDMNFRVISLQDKTCEVYNKNFNPAISKYTTGTVTVPDTAEVFKVIRIGTSAFYGIENITSVSLPEAVTEIGLWAFYGCKSLSSLTGVSNLEYIGGSAFYRNPWLDSIPDGIIYLGKVLYGYKGDMPDNTIVDVKEGTKSIYSSAFWNTTKLCGVKIPASLELIDGSNPFAGNVNLKSLAVDAGNKVYDSRNGCNAIIETKTSTLKIGGINTTIPSDVKVIGAFAFNGLDITSFVIPDCVDSIAGNAIYACGKLESLNVGKGLSKIGGCPVYSASALKSIVVSPDNQHFDSRNNCNAIIEKSSLKLLLGCSATDIPWDIKEISADAFYGNGSDGLKKIVIPANIEKIGNYAFCNLLNLDSVDIGKNVKEFGSYVFHNCNSLSTVISRSEYPVAISDNVFSCSNISYSIYDNAVLRVPEGSRLNYMMTDGWRNFKNVEEGVPAGIKSVSLDKYAGDKQVYDLGGQRLSKPRKGINIIGGKKVIVK